MPAAAGSPEIRRLKLMESKHHIVMMIMMMMVVVVVMMMMRGKVAVPRLPVGRQSRSRWPGGGGQAIRMKT
eukprot:3117368-Rhodomonas_salina.1